MLDTGRECGANAEPLQPGSAGSLRACVIQGRKVYNHLEAESFDGGGDGGGNDAAAAAVLAWVLAPF